MNEYYIAIRFLQVASLIYTIVAAVGLLALLPLVVIVLGRDILDNQ